MRTSVSLYEQAKPDDEIIEHIGIKRKSPKFQSALKASVEAGWLTLQQKHEEGKIISTFYTTEQGKQIVTVEHELASAKKKKDIHILDKKTEN